MQRLHGLLSSVLLEEANDNIQHNDGADNSALNPRFNSETHRHGENQDLQQKSLIRTGGCSTLPQVIMVKESCALLASLRWPPGG